MSDVEENAIYGPFEEKDNKKEKPKSKTDEEFDLNEADIFVDDNSPMMNHLNKCEEPLIGMEQIIDDQTNDNLKCILCRVILRDRYGIIQHLKDVQHQSLYMERYHPVVYNCLTNRRETAAKFCDLIKEYSIELVKEHGRKRCRTYIKDYHKTAAAAAAKESSKESTSKKSGSGSGSTSRKRSRSRSRSPHRFDKSRNHHTHRQYRQRDRRDSPEEASISRSVPNKAAPISSSDSKREEPEEEDVYGELPVDPEIMGVLFAAKLAEFGVNERAFVHNEMQAVKRPVVGLDFIAEYTDPRSAYQPGYLCVICDSRFSPSQILNHVACEKHRLKYMDRRHKSYFATVTLKTLPEDTRKDLIARYAGEIEVKEGRGAIRRKILIDETNRFIFRHHKPLSSPVIFGRKRTVRDPGPPQPQLSFDPSKFDVVDRRSVPLPPKIQQSSTRTPLPQRPNFVYSEKVEKEKQMAEMEKVLPPFVERSLESGWYSVRQFSLDYYQRLVPPLTPYISIRCPQAAKEIYGTWSPYVMRRMQDQFNFSIDHLTWLQKLLLDWRMPLSKPLEAHELRPLADDVEAAVLNALVGQTLQPHNFFERIHDRVVFEYDDQPTGSLKKKTKFETIEYGMEEDKAPVDSLVEETPQKFIRERRPSGSSSLGSSGLASATHPTFRSQSVLLTPTPSEDGQKSTATSAEKAAAERAMLALIDQILQTAKDSKSNNPILSLIVSFHNARSILFALATKQPATLQQLVLVMKNPNLVVPREALAQLEKKLNDVARECSELNSI